MAKIITIKFKPKKIVLENHGLEKNGKVHAYFTATCAKYMDKYVPFRSGDLAETVILNGEPTENVTKSTITYTLPYASYQYYGENADGSKKINPDNRDISKHEDATSYWDYVMMSIDGDDVFEEVQKFYDKEGGK